MTAACIPSAVSLPSARQLNARPKAPRAGLLTLAVLLHLGFFYALQNGLLRDVAPPDVRHPLPREVVTTLLHFPSRPAEKNPVAAPPAREAARQSAKEPANPAPAIQPAPLAPVMPRPAAVNTPVPAATTALTVPPLSPATLPTTIATTASTTQTAADQPVPATATAVTPTTPPPLTAAPPAAAATASRDGPKTVSGIEYLQAPRPAYPVLSKRSGEQGRVVLRILINEKGQPERVDIEQSAGFARLDEAARQAAWQALFKPHTVDGKPVAMLAIVPINFSIK